MKRALIAAALLALAPIAAQAQSGPYEDPVATQFQRCASDNASASDYLACMKQILQSTLPGNYFDPLLHQINQGILNIANPNWPGSDDNTDVSTPPAQNDNSDSGSNDQ